MLHGWCHMKCCHFGASSVYTIQSCTRLQCYFIQSHIGRMYVCLAVTCHLHFWQNDRDLLRATVGTRGCNGYQNKSQHRKLRRKFSHRSCWDSNPGPFDHESDALFNHWAIPPQYLTWNQPEKRNLLTLRVTWTRKWWDQKAGRQLSLSLSLSLSCWCWLKCCSTSTETVGLLGTGA